MKTRISKVSKRLLPILLVGLVLFAGLWLNGRIGVGRSGLEGDIRTQQKIPDDWTVDGTASDTMAAYLSYPEDRSRHTFSIYVRGSGLSLGYCFRSGGYLQAVQEGIAAFSLEGSPQRAFLSMNRAGAAWAELDDGAAIQRLALDSDRPFALVLPGAPVAVTFYDETGDVVEIRDCPL